MTDAPTLLAAYDAQLRGENEVLGATTRVRLGPLWVATWGRRRGFITAADPEAVALADPRALVAEALEAAAADPEVAVVEWKTRGHDRDAGLLDALVAAGFVPQEPESIMIGAAQLLALDLPLPDGVTLRAATTPEDVRRGSAAADRAFGEEPDEDRVAETMARIAGGDELWIAEAGGEIVCTGRLSPVPGTEFAGIWGGATDAAWRRRGIYRALTAERAKSAVRRGVRYINSDSTEGSRPILERGGFTKVSTTTPYEWHRGTPGG
ncbi:GNAT family N-acetyltransferase [uncultured Amnibacterium sp.]|uniref:GNAT family N-acetyltransferase n=1 Tax=uncultured Amnibacterium sp. TaxID=1631851 RepID=UPI0035CC75B0